jgi:hypothetical protein
MSPELMFPTSRNRESIGRHVFVVAVVICLFTFAIYLKVGPGYSGSTGSSQTKMWADPSERSGTHTKIAPLTFVFLLFVSLRFCKTEKPCAPVKVIEPLCKDIFFRSLHWFRPPPSLFLSSATV